ncbi:MAG: O-antigen ligase family protein, partial [bacterium]|nr:O-antigen ligase family protein [bacterium]
YLGERSFNIFTPGSAKASLSGQVFLRPYGTFSHPNSLAGFILVGLIFIFTQKKLFGVDKIALVVGFFLLLLCFSRTVWLAVLFLNLIYLIWRIIDKQKVGLFEFSYYFMAGAGLITVFLFTKSVIETASFENREVLAVFALELIKKQPFLGVGANNFLISLSRSGLSWPVVSFLQPVHNIFLLIGSEIGLVGLIVFITFLLLTVRRVPQFTILVALMAIVFTGLFDHYWLTLIQNQLLFVLILGLAWSKRVVK